MGVTYAEYKKTGIFVLGMLVTSNGLGQTLKFQPGISISKLSLDVHDYYRTSTSYLVGSSLFIGLDYIEKANITVSGNMGYVSKGGSGSIRTSLTDSEDDIINNPILNYVSLNTQVEIEIMSLWKTSGFITVGPRIDYLLNRYSDRFRLGFENLGITKRTSFGFIVGTGVKYQLLGFDVGICGSYNINLNNIVEDDDSQVGICDNTFSLNAIIRLRRKGE